MVGREPKKAERPKEEKLLEGSTGERLEEPEEVELVETGTHIRKVADVKMNKSVEVNDNFDVTEVQESKRS